jgi:hypothetical protein
MPLEVVEQDCEQSDGTSGSWVVKNKDTGEVESCHKTKQKASISAGFRSGEIEREEES